MRLLLDENFSPRLVTQLRDIATEVRHVRDVDLAAAPDVNVWTYARRYDLAIVSKDEDFYQISLVRGVPPKVIWVRTGNCTTADVERIIRDSADEIAAFLADTNDAAMILSR